MASSSLKNEIPEVKKRLLDLENEVEDFERRLREQTEQTKQSIDRLSIDCESICSKVWQEFDAIVEKTRVKARELCDDMRRKTSEQQSKWRLSLQEKEEILVKAGMWRNDLRHLLVTGTDEEEEVVCGLESVGAELSSRLHESFSPVEEGHFVVTFPEWCHRSLNQLQEEMIDFTVATWPPRNLELQSEWRLQDSNLWILSIVGSDEDGHVFVVDGGDNSIREFAESGEFVGQCMFRDKGLRFSPLDICRLSKDILVVCGSLWSKMRWVGGLVFLARKTSPPFLKREKIIGTKEKPFYSLCQMNEQIFVCDFDLKEILSFSKEGKKIRTIEIGASPLSGRFSNPLLRDDPTTGNLWGTKLGMTEILIINKNGEILQKVETEDKIRDFRGDGFGQFYFSTLEGIFSVSPEKVLYKFPKKSEKFPKIFVSLKKLFVCFQNDGKKLLKI